MPDDTDEKDTSSSDQSRESHDDMDIPCAQIDGVVLPEVSNMINDDLLQFTQSDFIDVEAIYCCSS